MRTAARLKKLAVLCLRLTTKDNGRYNPNRVGRGHRACDVQLAQGRRSKPGHRAGRYASVVGSAARQSVLGHFATHAVITEPRRRAPPIGSVRHPPGSFKRARTNR
ncbi:MAG: hypothetical protein QOF66_779 [Mycobacterium sp.]|nr:hypothetical protein [Mycobacterium sp.]